MKNDKEVIEAMNKTLSNAERFVDSLPIWQRKLISGGEKLGYHKREIMVKGVLGESSKILEEVDEFNEAIEQNNKILAMCELSDIYGALEELAINNGVSMKDLKKMSDCTKEAFKEGLR